MLIQLTDTYGKAVFVNPNLVACIESSDGPEKCYVNVSGRKEMLFIRGEAIEVAKRLGFGENIRRFRPLMEIEPSLEEGRIE